MYPQIEIEEQINDFNKIVWRFILFEFTLVLDAYSNMEKQSKRHNFRIKEFWSRLDSRQNNKSEPNIPNHIKHEVLMKCNANLKVVSASEYHKR